MSNLRNDPGGRYEAIMWLEINSIRAQRAHAMAVGTYPWAAFAEALLEDAAKWNEEQERGGDEDRPQKKAEAALAAGRREAIELAKKATCPRCALGQPLLDPERHRRPEDGAILMCGSYQITEAVAKAGWLL